MRARSIKPGFFVNPELAALGPYAMLLFEGLWLLADREGRLEYRPNKIRAQIFPYWPRVRVEDILHKLVQANFITTYSCDDSSWIAIPAWHKHQTPHYKELPSTIPPPPGVDNKYSFSPVNKKQAQRIIERDNGACQSCGTTYDLSIDHIISRANGGDSSDDNLRTLCRRCNSAKGSRDGQPIIKRSSDDDQPTLDNPSALLSCIPESLFPDSTTLPLPPHRSPGPVAPKPRAVSSQPEWPLTSIAVRESYPAVDDIFVVKLASASCAVAAGVNGQLTDSMLADAVRECRKTSNGQTSAGLFLRTVPQCVKTWFTQGKSPPNESDENWIEEMLKQENQDIRQRRESAQ
jgi:hypothetical protein